MFTSTLKFPSGRSVKRLKQDAKALAKQSGVPLHQALDEIAECNGAGNSWSQAVRALNHQPQINLSNPKSKSRSQLAEELGITDVEPFPAKTDMYPYRKLMVLGLNELLSRKLLSLEWDGKSDEATAYIEAIIAGHNTIIAWSGIGFGEMRISVWWKYDHSKHPQANLTGNSRESFSCASPLAKRQHYPRFVGVVCSAWFERKEGKYLQGEGSHSLFEKYTRKGELECLKQLPNPVPLGYEPEGRFHM